MVTPAAARLRGPVEVRDKFAVAVEQQRRPALAGPIFPHSPRQSLIASESMGGPLLPRRAL
jgi:hypothetical protein